MDIEALDVLQVELRERGLRTSRQTFMLPGGEGKAGLIGVRYACDRRSRVALCNRGHSLKTSAPVRKEVSVDLPLLRNTMHVHSRFNDDAEAAFTPQNHL